MKENIGFYFYFGDYLRDTQTLSCGAQVAYDRIMCELGRSGVVSPAQVDFFCKGLEPAERERLVFVLKEVPGGYTISWVERSLAKTTAYRESRRRNRAGGAAKGGSATPAKPVGFSDFDEPYYCPLPPHLHTESAMAAWRLFLDNWRSQKGKNMPIEAQEGQLMAFTLLCKNSGMGAAEVPAFFEMVATTAAGRQYYNLRPEDLLQQWMGRQTGRGVLKTWPTDEDGRAARVNKIKLT